MSSLLPPSGRSKILQHYIWEWPKVKKKKECNFSFPEFDHWRAVKANVSKKFTQVQHWTYTNHRSLSIYKLGGLRSKTLNNKCLIVI